MGQQVPVTSKRTIHVKAVAKGRCAAGFCTTFSLAIILFLLMIFATAACQPAALVPPRYATETARAISPLLIEDEAIYLPAPTATGDAALLEGDQSGGSGADTGNTNLTLWLDDQSHAVIQEMARLMEDFSQRTSVDVEIVVVPSLRLPELIQTAAISDTLPDLVLHPVEYAPGWAEQGIIDGSAASSVIEQLSPETFQQFALDLVALEHPGAEYASIPVDGRKKVIIYRRDWFEQLNLAPPDTYESLLVASESIYNPEQMISGLVVPTDSDLTSTQQVFEFLALVNGCELVDENGEVTLLHPACLEALDFYREVINLYSPVGVQTDISALNAYLSGRTGVIMVDPGALVALAGLDASFRPACPECDEPGFLVQNSGVLTQLEGRDEFAAPSEYALLNVLSITTSSDRETAIELAKYWLEEIYGQWLAFHPELKLPVRTGTRDEPGKYERLWQELALTANGTTLKDIFGEDVVRSLSFEDGQVSRWAFSERQGAIMTRIYEELALSPLLQDMLSGYFTSSQTIVEMYRTVVDLIPDYAFAIEVQSTPESR